VEIEQDNSQATKYLATYRKSIHIANNIKHDYICNLTNSKMQKQHSVPNTTHILTRNLHAIASNKTREAAVNYNKQLIVSS